MTNSIYFCTIIVVNGVIVPDLHKGQGHAGPFHGPWCDQLGNHKVHVHPDSKVHGGNTGSMIRGLQDPDGPHVGPMNFTIWADLFVRAGGLLNRLVVAAYVSETTVHTWCKLALYTSHQNKDVDIIRYAVINLALLLFFTLGSIDHVEYCLIMYQIISVAHEETVNHLPIHLMWLLSVVESALTRCESMSLFACSNC